jgi:hypothetical protein
MRLFSNKKNQSTRTLGQRRSLTHQTSESKTFFYHSQRSIESKPTKRQTLRYPLKPQTVSRVASFSLQRFGLLIVIIVAIVSLINVLAVSSNPRVILLNQQYQSGYLHTAAEYQKAAKKLFSNSFVNSNKITVNMTGISADLTRQFPELSDVIIKLPLVGRDPIIYLSPNKVLIALSASNGTSYAIDANGQVVGNISRGSFTSLQLINIQDDSSATVNIGQFILSTSTVTFIQTVIYQVEQRQLTISKLILPAEASELDMYLVGQPYFVKFNLNDPDPLQEVGTFLAVQHYLKGQNITPAQYIDARVAGRAYYK